MRAALLCFVFAVVAACGGEHSERCSDICSQEATCAEEITDDETFKFDRGACTAACSFLERDEKSKSRVDSHAACVAQAGGACDKILACK